MTLEQCIKSAFLSLALLLLNLPLTVAAQRDLPLQQAATLVGASYVHLIRPGETLIELARHAGVGYGTLLQANPDIDPWQPRAGTEILIPRATVVPYEVQPGITVNLAEKRLYLIQQEQQDSRIRVYPIGIGREGSNTPTGSYRVIIMIASPSWTPPESIRAERPELPALVPPGPDNPLGDYWIGLSEHQIGLHGTNRPYGIGRQVSSGCIRLYPEHIDTLFRHVHIGMPVTIIDSPLKLGFMGDLLYLEAHPDPDSRVSAPLTEIIRQRDLIAPGEQIDWHKVRLLLEQRTGVPHPISPSTAPSRQY